MFMQSTENNEFTFERGREVTLMNKKCNKKTRYVEPDDNLWLGEVKVDDTYIQLTIHNLLISQILL